MKIVIAGFQNEEEGIREVNKWVEKFGYFLFTIVCRPGSLAERIAEKLGAPVEYFYENNMEKILLKIPKMIDYAIVKYDGENVWIRRLIMNIKDEGKHGWIIKKESNVIKGI